MGRSKSRPRVVGTQVVGSSLFHKHDKGQVGSWVEFFVP